MIDQTEIRQKAFDGLMPAWSLARGQVAVCTTDVNETKAELKVAKEGLARIERSLEHVTDCRMIACLLCSEIATNGPTKTA